MENNIINIKNLNFSYKDKELFKDFELTVKRGEWLSIAGPNSAGKTTLVKLISGLIRDGGFIQIDGLILTDDNLKDIRRKIGVVFTNPDNTFVAETVVDELAFPLENLKYTKTAIRKRIKEIASKIGIEKILKEEPHRLSGGEKELVAIAVALVHEPKVLIIDEALSMLDNTSKESILKTLKSLNKEGLTIITLTNDLEETLLSDRLLILKDGKKIISGTLPGVFKEDRLIEQANLNLPFIVDLSLKLNFYGLLNKIYLDKKEMVNDLWK